MNTDIASLILYSAESFLLQSPALPAFAPLVEFVFQR